LFNSASVSAPCARFAACREKVLAKVSGISERYIAQLESGKGNVSIVLLRRVSHAMGAHLEDLIPDGQPAPDWPVIRDLLRKATPSRSRKPRIFSRPWQRRLSAAAKLVRGNRADRLARRRQIHARQNAGEEIGWNFVELNKEIEAQNGLSVAEIIALYGQEGFRRMEQAALGQLLAKNELTVSRPAVASSPNRHLRPHPVVVLHHLAEAEPEEHMARVRRQGDLRPMADDRSAMSELRTILKSREPLYARASAVVDTAGLSVDDAATRLIDAVAPVLKNEARMFALHSAVP